MVGLPDKDWKERRTSFISPQKGQPPDPTALKAYLKKQLAGFKIPKEFIVVEDLTKNNGGKLLKWEIKKQFG